jgi:hypothetical protein
MTYSYDRRTAADPDLAYLEEFVRRARPFPSLLAPVANFLKTPLIEKEIDLMRATIRDFDEIIKLLKDPSKENNHKANGLLRKYNVETEELASWGLYDYISEETGLAKRLNDLSPMHQDNAYRLYWDTLGRLIKRTRSKLRDR